MLQWRIEDEDAILSDMIHSRDYQNFVARRRILDCLERIRFRQA